MQNVDGTDVCCIVKQDFTNVDRLLDSWSMNIHCGLTELNERELVSNSVYCKIELFLSSVNYAK